MIDQNAIIEIINQSLPILASSPVLVKLTDVVGSVIQTLYLPALTFKKGKAEVDVEMYRKQREQELLENQTFTLYEITKLKNFVHAANYAAEELNNLQSENMNSEPIDFDWVMRFFDAVGNISNEELQKLWGKVLAGEINRRGTCSLRTLDIIRNMSQKEAKTFQTLCAYVVHSGDCHFIFDSGFAGKLEYNEASRQYIQDHQLKYIDHVVPMIECGLLSVDNDLSTDFQADSLLTMYNPDVICLLIDKDRTNTFLNINTYFLTISGFELYNIISNSPDFVLHTEYQLRCFQELKQMYPALTVTAHAILKSGKMDPEELLH